MLPQSVVQPVKSPYPSTQDPDYDQMLHTEFAAVVNNRDSAVSSLLDAHAAESVFDAPQTGSAFGGRRWALEQILTLDAFLTNYWRGRPLSERAEPAEDPGEARS